MGCAGPCGDVVEFGCGYGTFTIPAARLVRARVFALDIDSEMINAVAIKARENSIQNVFVERRDFAEVGCGRPDSSIGYAMLFNILHVENPISLLREAFRALEPGGAIGIIHWKHDAKSPRGPSLEIRPTPEAM